MNVRIYIEGGGHTRTLQAPLRIGFAKFFRSLADAARTNRNRIDVIMCGSRGEAFRDFQRALRQYLNDFIVLLVDSESPVATGSDAKAHLNLNGSNAPNTSAEQYHLMVELMESWFLADPEALDNFYGHGFRPSAIPKRSNIEAIAKSDVLSALESATRDSQKGRYIKRHASELLLLVDPSKVQKAAPHCKRLFDTILSHVV